MCGRYASSRSDAELVEAYAVDAAVGPEVGPSWNVAPTQEVRAVVEREPRDDEPDGGGSGGGEGRAQRQLRTFRWGLVPSWAKDPKIGSRMINARIETVTEKPAYRRAAARRRCLVPADGYFEWERREGPNGKEVKVPHYLHDAGGAPLTFAGLYELWRDPAADDAADPWRWTLTVITTRAADAAGRIHDRSPLVLPEDFREDWLDPALTDLGLVRQVLDAVPAPQLATHEVGRAVGSPRVNGPQLVLPLDDAGA